MLGLVEDLVIAIFPKLQRTHFTINMILKRCASFWEEVEGLLVKDLMEMEFPILAPQQTVITALTVLIESGVQDAPVVSEDGYLGCFILDGRVVKGVLENRSSNSPLLVSDLMRINIPVAREEQEITDISFQNNPMVPVMNGEKQITGVLRLQKLANKMQFDIDQQLSWLNQVVESVHNGILAIDDKGCLVLCNSSARQTFGFGPEASGEYILNIFHRAPLLDVLSTGQPVMGESFEFNGRRVIANRTPVISGDKIIGAVSVFQDTSEIEEVSTRLASIQAINDELSTIFQASNDGIFITDGEGSILRGNRASERILGYPPEGLIGKRVSDLVEKGIINRSVTMEVLKAQKPATIKQRTAIGKEYIATGTPIFDQEGRIYRVITNLRDITELVELELALESTKAHADELASDNAAKRSQIMQENGLTTESQSMLKVVDLALKVAQVDATVLILGETGVGKELIAKLIHRTSEREKSGQFIKVNCGAIPSDLLESEFFGYESGAFTGANKEGKPGYFELANQGTLFLDEVGELPLLLQVKLLRVIQERELIRLGGTKTRKVNTRIIAATNRDLEKMVNEGVFREDLFYRLNVLPVNIPPLRNRPEDIPVLLTSFLDKYSQKYGTGKMFSGDSLALLCRYNWPGNVRELENLVERLVITCDESVVYPSTWKYRFVARKNLLGTWKYRFITRKTPLNYQLMSTMMKIKLLVSLMVK